MTNDLGIAVPQPIPTVTRYDNIRYQITTAYIRILVPFLCAKTSCRNADPATLTDGSVSDDERVLEVGGSVLSRSPLAKLYMQ